MSEKIVCVSGGFDPIHIGHVRMIQEAAKYGEVVVILNNDNWLRAKKGFVFMPEVERMEIVAALKGVSKVILTGHEEFPKDHSVCFELEYLRPDIFCNGGDRKEGCIPTAEEEVCKRLGIQMLFNVGGGKIQSSSELVRRSNETRTVLEVT